VNILREWKKVYEADLGSVVLELVEFLEKPAVILLSGELGSGKTTFTKAFVNKMNTGVNTTSPSYSLVQEAGDIVHSDFYRLNDASEVVHLELPMYLEGKNYLFVEWGKGFLRELYQEIPHEFSFYEILFEVINENVDTNRSSRNLKLISLPNQK